ncbi:MAG: hypothetical protein ACE5KE_14670 [Methanosarcinales archaeon]
MVYVATLHRKNSLEFQGYHYKFVKLNPKKFFGYKEIEIDNNPINIAEKEKAIIDCLDQERYSGTILETAKALKEGKKELDFEVLIDYAIKMNNFSLNRRLGYLLDELNIDSKKLENLIGDYRPVYLSTKLPSKNKKYEKNKKWKLIINVD